MGFHGTFKLRQNPFGCIARHTDIPVVVSIQGDLAVISHKYTAGFGKEMLRSRRNVSLSLKSLLFSPFSWESGYRHIKKRAAVEAKNTLHFKYVIGRTDWDRRVTRIQAPNSAYYHVGEVMRPVFYNYSWQPHRHTKLIVNTTNGDSYFKGFETVCYALHLLRQIGLDIEWRVAGIGPNDSVVRLAKRKLGDKYPVSGLTLMGNLSEEELAKSLLDADIYVMASHIENSPNNLCEAMLLGLPCIATFAGGTSSMLRDGVDGILIQDGDPWAMAGAVLEYSQNYDEAIKKGVSAKEHAKSMCDINNVVEDLLTVYNDISNGK